MKSRTLTCITAIVLFAALALPAQLIAQGQNRQEPRYGVTDLGTLGGTFSVALGISNKGWVTGNALLRRNTAQHAFLRRNGVKTDLGTLGGPNSGTSGGSNERGDVVGWAETSTPDPSGENTCGNSLICLPFLWQRGVMTPLPTLGGNNGFANDINNRGQIVGFAENATPDPTCPPGASFFIQTPPALWEEGAIQELPTFPGDPDGTANAINEQGQAVGGSGNCTTNLHALLWQKGTVTDLGNLGGALFSGANAINDRGQVIGSSDLPGDTNFFAGPFSNNHAFSWKNGVIADLGTLPGDATSFAISLNNKGQVVGESIVPGSSLGGGSRAVLWQNGTMTDLNTLVPGRPFSPLYLLQALDINERAEIVGVGLSITGEQHAFLATPCDEDHSALAGCQDDAGSTSAVTPTGTAPLTTRFGPITLGNPALGGRARQFPGRLLTSPGNGPTSNPARPLRLC